VKDERAAGPAGPPGGPPPGGAGGGGVADGDWEVTLTQPRHEQGEPIPAQFRGRSDTATAPFEVDSGPVRIRMRAARPEERFRVLLFRADGSERRQLLDTEGPADEVRTGRLGAGIYLFDVRGRGEWAVDVTPGR
jgi:hypothetical protein